MVLNVVQHIAEDRIVLTTASAVGVDVGTIIASSVEVVLALRVSVGTASGQVEGGCIGFKTSWNLISEEKNNQQ